VAISLDLVTDGFSTARGYAYDAYFIECARRYKAPLLTLDTALLEASKLSGVRCVEV